MAMARSWSQRGAARAGCCVNAPPLLARNPCLRAGAQVQSVFPLLRRVQGAGVVRTSVEELMRSLSSDEMLVLTRRATLLPL